ncbi:DUF3342 domain containing protein [Trypanosoma rangeli]|uniref:DUF3342 domain containing protein n=1 Tax=Trypanosoma rangeli TaxID=5698 RepID=A0A3S5ISD3_TRYRA|nr:DUF3342 domain containing protein [Trypanosoma rangeli]RNF10706.1 DUF3342 domain containing protein [Trypanosoma rangeli]|eukprot:RNF10706.1 DUF3342 domain containing protein [Trypanosoma rangeli]
MTRKLENGGAVANHVGGDRLSNSTPYREVEVTVYDKLLNEVRAFRCDQQLLENSMVYFVPIIRRYLEEEAEEERKNRLGAEEERSRDMTATSAAATNKMASGHGTDVSVDKAVTGIDRRGQGDVRQSSQPKLTSPLPPIPIRVNCDLSIFSWLMAYVQGKRRPFTPENAVSIALSSNFLLMTQLVDLPLQYIKENLVQVMLSGVSMECLTGELLARLCSMLSEGDLARTFLKFFEWRVDYSANRRVLTALLRHVVCDRLGERQANGLCWCQYCGVLFDQHELHRLERSAKNVKPALCPRLRENSIGTRGEILTTHVASNCHANLVFPSISWSDEHVERWAWRIIGATHFFVCGRCNHLVPLIDTMSHGCCGGMANFSCTEGGSRADADALLAWYAVSKDLYAGGLTPMYSHQTDVPREVLLTLSPTGEWTCEDRSDHAVPGLWCTHPIAVERSVSINGNVNLDTQNGFERWLVLGLQQMMEEFGRRGEHNVAGDDAHTPLSPVTGLAWQLPTKLGSRGTEYMARTGSGRPSHRDNRGVGRGGLISGSDAVTRRKELVSNNNLQRANATSGGTPLAYDPNKTLTSSSLTNFRVKSAQNTGLSLRSLKAPGSSFAKTSPAIPQNYR